MRIRKWIYLPVMSLLVACAGAANRTEDQRSASRKAAEVNTSLGQEYMSRGQNEIALDKLRKAASADPNYAPAHTMLAVLYERLGNSEQAEKHYKLALKAAPANGDVNNNYGVFLCKSGRVQAAESYFMLAVKDPFYRTPAVAYANAGSCHMQQGNLDKAESFLRQSLEYDAKFPDALLPMAGVSEKQGEYLRARAFLQRYEATGSESAASLAMGARIESQLGNKATADAYRKRLLQNFPGSPQATEVMDQLNS